MGLILTGGMVRQAKYCLSVPKIMAVTWWKLLLMQGLLAVHQYYVNGTSDEKELAARIDKLWREVDWNFTVRTGKMCFIGIGAPQMAGP